MFISALTHIKDNIIPFGTFTGKVKPNPYTPFCFCVLAHRPQFVIAPNMPIIVLMKNVV